MAEATGLEANSAATGQRRGRAHALCPRFLDKSPPVHLFSRSASPVISIIASSV
jgi:hypothetical protein